MRTTDSRKAAYKRGLKAEKIARVLLRLKGYRILAERYSNAFGEIDIIAQKKDVLALVEVKSRDSLRGCLECITPRMQARQIKAARSLLAYPGVLAPHVNVANLSIRFDLICIVPMQLPRHITNAWQTN